MDSSFSGGESPISPLTPNSQQLKLQDSFATIKFCSGRHCKIYFTNADQHHSLVNAIVEAQGFNNRLDQYSLVGALPDGFVTRRRLVQHKLTTIKFEIRSTVLHLLPVNLDVFKDEIAAMMRLARRSCVLHLTEVMETHDRLVAVYETCEDQTLSDLIGEGSGKVLSVAAACSIFA